jgi:hypothetical protein
MNPINATSYNQKRSDQNKSPNIRTSPGITQISSKIIESPSEQLSEQSAEQSAFEKKQSREQFIQDNPELVEYLRQLKKKVSAFRIREPDEQPEYPVRIKEGDLYEKGAISGGLSKNDEQHGKGGSTDQSKPEETDEPRSEFIKDLTDIDISWSETSSIDEANKSGQFEGDPDGSIREGRKINRIKRRIYKAEGDIIKIRGGIIGTERIISDKENEIEQTKTEINKFEDGIIVLDSEIEKYHDPKSNIILKRYCDVRPVQGRKYFLGSVSESYYNIEYKNVQNGIAVIIPFFNEPSHELQQTLNSLYDTWEYLKDNSIEWKNQTMYVCLIQDGWHKADPSMKEYLKKMFDKKVNGVDWWKHYPEFDDNYENKEDNITFILERKNQQTTRINTQSIYDNNRKDMKISLIIKINNRRKHNSHEWFLGESGFAESVKAKYLFMTDAFTFYHKTCLYHLVNDLDQHPNIAAVTGRQRAMLRSQQGSSESIFSLGYMLRMVQLYDFELSNAVYNGAFSLGGLLPVIPGPCGLYRAEDVLNNKARDWYFSITNAEPDKTGIILGNVRIAEDRILSYSSVLKADGHKQNKFNPLALFYFEAETSIHNLMLQRRRWINGAVAGYIYLLFQSFGDYRHWNASFVRKVYVWILLMCQFLIYCLVTITPAISIRIFYYGLNYLLTYYNLLSNDETELIIVACILWTLYIVHVFVHHKLKFNYVVIYCMMFVSFLTSIVGYWSLGLYVYNLDKSIFTSIQAGGPIIYLALVVYFGPFVLSALLSARLHSTVHMIKAFIPYQLFLPMLIAWFGSYSFARAWDLSWGNRPSSELNDVKKDQRDFMVTKFKEKNIKIIVALIALNLIVFFIPFEGQMILMGIFLAIASYQMVLSLIFCLFKITYKIGFVCNRCVKRVKRKKLADIESVR